MTSVVTPSGIAIPTLQDLIDALGSDQKSNVDPLLSTDPTNGDSVEAQFNGPFCSAQREAYEDLQTISDALDPAKAEDERLDVVCSLTGTTRRPAKPSRFTGTREVLVNLNAGKTLSAGKLFSIAGRPDLVFETTRDAVNPGGSPADISVSAECTVTGPTPANAGTATVIVSSETGWNSVTNPLDVVLGNNVESNESLRLRRDAELRGGATNNDAIRAALLQMTDTENPSIQPIQEAFILANNTDAIVNGVAAHGLEAIIWDGPGSDAANGDVAKTIYAKTDPGDAYSGSVISIVIDSYGFGHPVRFSRCTQRQVSFRITFTYDSIKYVGDVAAKAVLAASFQTGADYYSRAVQDTKQRPHKTVEFSPYLSVFQSVPGVKAITLWEMHLDGDAFSSWTNLPVDFRSIALADTSLITLLGTAG
jgi:hypothetical protein